MPNKLSQFWHELKRRNVVRVIAVYAGAAFVIIELVNNITEPLRLPDWTPTLVIVLLAIGFPVAIIFSWIYDMHPEGGMVKTESPDKIKAETPPKSSNSWKIASYISFVVIVVLIVLNVIPRSDRLKGDINLEKSIAVLPLDYLSEDPNKEYLANAVLDAITGHLSTIKGLRVMPRTSVEQYRENKKSAKQIGEELDVSYLIDGSFLMIENQVKLTIQMVIAAEGDHVFFKEYDRKYEDILKVQSEVAQTIAKEIEIAITPIEKQIIDIIPTTNLTAYDFYQRGKEEHWKYWSDNDYREALDRAEKRYQDALEYDPEFAKAYAGLARVYWDKHYWDEYFSENFLDSVLILVDVALLLDDQLAEAYTIRGDYYREKKMPEQAIREYDKAIEFNPNDWRAYKGKGELYWFISDFVKAIDNYQKAVKLNRGSELPILLGSLGMAYRSIGFIEMSKEYSRKALKLSGDSIAYYRDLSYCEIVTGNYMKGVYYAEKLQKIDTNNVGNLSRLGFCYVFLGQHEEALDLYKRYIEISKIGQDYSLFDMHRIGWAYWLNGYIEEAEYYFKEQIEYCNSMNELGRGLSDSNRTAYDLAAVYAFMGEKVTAYENLRIHNQRQANSLGHFTRIKNDPLFESIRGEPEFQQIVRDIEAKYLAEHERVRQWLEENDML